MRVRPVCKFDGCDRVSVKSCRGWCQKHYARWYRHGDPSIVKSSASPMRHPALAILERTIITDHGCWEWIGAKLPNGYGVFSFNGRPRYVHRTAWHLATGEEPDEMHIHHTCRNKACVNADHLVALSPDAHNVEHAEERRVRAMGEKNPRAKLTANQVEQIRNRLARGERRDLVAADYGISSGNVGKIARGERWAA